MSLTIDDLFTDQTSDQVLETFLANLETLGVPARSWRPGGALRTILRVVATVFAFFTTILVAFIKSGFLESATGGWLTLLARNVYGVERISSTFASGQATITNAGGGLYTFQAGTLRLLAPSLNSKAYVNVATFTLNPSSSITVDITAVESGSGSTAPPGAISQLETTLPFVTVTNTAAVVGTDAQTDAALQQVCKNKLGALSLRGPRGAYAYAVATATRMDGTPVDINRFRISPSSSTGVVDVYCASPSGAPITSDLDAVATSIENVARPDTVTVNVLAASALPLVQSLTVWARRTAGVSATDLANLVEAAVINMVATYPIGGIPKPPSTQGYLWASTIDGTVKAAHPSIYAIDGVGGDLALSIAQVVTITTTMPVNVRIVDVATS